MQPLCTGTVSSTLANKYQTALSPDIHVHKGIFTCTVLYGLDVRSSSPTGQLKTHAVIKQRNNLLLTIHEAFLYHLFKPPSDCCGFTDPGALFSCLVCFSKILCVHTVDHNTEVSVSQEKHVNDYILYYH